MDEDAYIKIIHSAVRGLASIGWSPKDIQEELDNALDNTFTEVKEDK